MEGNILLISLILWPFASAVICYLAGWRRIPYGVPESTESESEAKARKEFRNILVIGSVFLEIVLYVLAILSLGKNGNTLHVDKICGLGINLYFGGFRTVYAGVALLMWRVLCTLQEQKPLLFLLPAYLRRYTRRIYVGRSVYGIYIL